MSWYHKYSSAVWFFCAIFLALLLIFIIRKWFTRRYPYQAIPILTKREYRFYFMLRREADRRNLIICPKVGLKDLIGVTAKKDGQIVTNGGRVLGVVAKGEDLKKARANAYEAIKLVEFDNKYYRHDIGKAIDEA